MTDQLFYTSDQPIKSREEDRFNRWPFAKRIADTLARRTDPSSLVVGIYGAWGDGKTSVLQLMAEALKEYPDVVLMRFNPWHFEHQAELLKGFFAALAQVLGKSLSSKKEEVGKLLGRYGWILSLASLSVAGGALQVSPGEGLREFGRELSTVDLDELRARLETILREEKKRVIILIDDIDRLDRREIQSIFKLVKLSAGFERISYVLAFDEAVVASSLGERYGEGGTKSGREFLEKIVQVPLHLPPADELSLRQLAFDGVNEALKLADIDLSEEDVRVFVRYFVDGLESRLTTPRRAKLYSNALSFALPLLKGEVHPVDQMLIEGVRVFLPKLYTVIRENPDVFLGSAGRLDRDGGSKKRAAELISNGLEGIESNECERVRDQLLAKLFPRLQSVFGNTHYGPDSDARWDRERRIASREYFSRYFNYSIPRGDLPDQAIETFLESAEKADSQGVERMLGEISERHALPRLVQKLRQRAAVLGEAEALSLAQMVVQNGAQFPREESPFSPETTFSQAAILVYNLLERVADKSKRGIAALNLTRQAEPLLFALECFRWLHTDNESPENQRIITAQEETEIGRALAARTKVEAQTEALWRKYPQDAGKLLFVWQQYGESGEVAAHLDKYFASFPAEVGPFLTIYMPTAWGLESGLPHKAELRRNAYEAIKLLIEPEKIVSYLRNHYGNVVDSGEYFLPSSVPVEKRAAIQFVYIHNKVKQELAQSADAAKRANEEQNADDSEPKTEDES